MNIYLFHGEDTTSSRKHLSEVIVEGEKRELDGLKLTPKDLESILATSNLFSNETLVIENLFSRLKSKDKDQCIQLLVNYAGDKQILLWEKKELTKAVLAKLPKSWKINLSKPPQLLFTFLDSLIPGNARTSLQLFHDLLRSTPDILIATMLARHVTNLLLAQSATSSKLPPWQLGKLKSQASHWSETALIHFHDELLHIDFQVKTGTTKLDYTSQLDILLLTVLG